MGSVTRGRAAAGFALVSACGMAALLTAQAPSSSRLPLSTLKLPPGFSISVYAENVPNARSMALSPGGTLFVGTRTAGNVYAVVDADKDGKADEVVTIATGLEMPNGVAFRDGALYVAEVCRILRFDDIEAALEQAARRPVVGTDAFPTGPAPRLEVHRVRARLAALRAGRRAVQRLRARRRALRVDHARCEPDGTRPARSSRAGSATPSASTGTRARRSSGSPTTAATGWATTCRRTS